MHVQLKKSWPGKWQRHVRDEDGTSVFHLRLTRGQTAEIPTEFEAAIRRDFSGPLIEVTIDEQGRVRPVRRADEPEAAAEPTPQKRQRRRSEQLVEA